ncbi:MAG: cupin domain-containing protein [Solirubrobacterales bacterium]
MGVSQVDLGAGEQRRPGIPDGPLAEVLIGPDRGLGVGAVQITVAPGAGMPVHDHGPSDALLIPLAGAVRLLDADGRAFEAGAGTVVAIPRGERVRLENVGSEEARLVAVFSPADFVGDVQRWPLAGHPAARACR